MVFFHSYQNQFGTDFPSTHPRHGYDDFQGDQYRQSLRLVCYFSSHRCTSPHEANHHFAKQWSHHLEHLLHHLETCRVVVDLHTTHSRQVVACFVKQTIEVLCCILCSWRIRRTQMLENQDLGLFNRTCRIF